MCKAGDRLGRRRSRDLHVELLLKVDDLDVVEPNNVLVLLVEVLLEAVVGDVAVVDGGEGVDVLDLVGSDGVPVGVVLHVQVLVVFVLARVGIFLQPPAPVQYL